MQLSGGPYSYNRFDAYESSLDENRQAAMTAGESEGKKTMRTAGKPAKVTGGKAYTMMGKDGKPLFSEGTGASDPHKMKAVVDSAAMKKREESSKLKKTDKKQEVKQEKETMDEGMKPLPKEKMERQSNKAYAKEVVAAQHGKGGEANKQMQRRIAMNDPSSRKAAVVQQEE